MAWFLNLEPRTKTIMYTQVISKAARASSPTPCWTWECQPSLMS